MSCFPFQMLWNIWVSRYNRKASGKKKSIFATPEHHFQQFIEIRCHVCICIIDLRCVIKLPEIYSAEITVIFSDVLFSHQLGLQNKNSARNEMYSYCWAPAAVSLVSQLGEDGRFDAIVASAVTGLARFAPSCFCNSDFFCNHCFSPVLSLILNSRDTASGAANNML